MIGGLAGAGEHRWENRRGEPPGFVGSSKGCGREHSNCEPGLPTQLAECGQCEMRRERDDTGDMHQIWRALLLRLLGLQSPKPPPPAGVALFGQSSLQPAPRLPWQPQPPSRQPRPSSSSSALAAAPPPHQPGQPAPSQAPSH